MSMELRIAHGMQLLYGQGAAFMYLFICTIVCVLSGVQQRTGATHSILCASCSMLPSAFVRLLQGARVFLLF